MSFISTDIHWTYSSKNQVLDVLSVQMLIENSSTIIKMCNVKPYFSKKSISTVQGLTIFFLKGHPVSGARFRL